MDWRGFFPAIRLYRIRLFLYTYLSFINHVAFVGTRISLFYLILSMESDIPFSSQMTFYGTAMTNPIFFFCSYSSQPLSVPVSDFYSDLLSILFII